MRKLCCFAGCVLLSAGTLWGEDFPGRPEGMSDERLELIFMWRLIDELEIGEEQAAQLFPIWSQHQRQRRAVQKQRREAAVELSHLLDERSSEDKLKKQIEKLRKIEGQFKENEQRFHSRLGEVLSVRQQAQLLLFEGRFRKDLREMIRHFRGFRGEGEGAHRWQRRRE